MHITSAISQSPRNRLTSAQPELQHVRGTADSSPSTVEALKHFRWHKRVHIGPQRHCDAGSATATDHMFVERLCDAGR
ncbi:hypothetical protein SVAN01_03258 [Stagonosporopsis vannaccii]|nr:hypothetical protein SVAN01_03258 [Stagonosporopsis vannaccii]